MMEGYPLSVVICVLVWGFSAKLTTSFENVRECYDERDSGCVSVQLQALTFAGAMDDCHGRGGFLTPDFDSSTSAALAGLAAQNGLESVWIGGRGTPDDWAWIGSGKKIGYQGCFSDYGASDPFSQDTEAGTVQGFYECIRLCEGRGKKYAGLRTQTTLDQYELWCYCADTYKLEATTQGCYGCRTLSQDASITFCGSDAATAVYLASAFSQFSAWESGALVPNNEFCTFVNSQTNYEWRDSPCKSRKSYICEYKLYSETECEVFGDEAADGDAYFWWTIANVCVSVHSMGLPWYEALQDCGERQGYLLHILSSDEQDDISGRLAMHNMGPRLWIGLTRWHWQWAGSERNIYPYGAFYSNWAVDQPEDVIDQRCMKIYEQDSIYKWWSADCGATKPSYCWIEPEFPTTDAGPDDGNGTHTGADTSDVDNTILFIALGISMGLLLLIIIVSVVIWKCCRSQNPAKIPAVQRQLSQLSNGMYEYIDESVPRNYEGLNRNGRGGSHVYQKPGTSAEGPAKPQGPGEYEGLQRNGRGAGHVYQKPVASAEGPAKPQGPGEYEGLQRNGRGAGHVYQKPVASAEGPAKPQGTDQDGYMSMDGERSIAADPKGHALPDPAPQGTAMPMPRRAFTYDYARADAVSPRPPGYDNPAYENNGPAPKTTGPIPAYLEVLPS